jgi:ABC-type proline/glycine betaine transport system permease subunit
MTMTHARFLRGHRGRWLWSAVVLPAAIAILVCGAGRLVISDGSRVVLASLIALTGAGAFLATALSTPVVREWFA